MKKWISRILAAGVMASIMSVNVQAAENLTVIPTGIQADGVGNYEGYGSIFLNGPEGGPNMHSLIRRDGTVIFPYAYGGGYTVYDGVISYGGDGAQPQYFDVNGNPLFTQITLPEVLPDWVDPAGFGDPGAPTMVPDYFTPMVGGYTVARLNYNGPYAPEAQAQLEEWNKGKGMEEWEILHPGTLEVFIDKTGKVTCITGSLGSSYDSHFYPGVDIGWFGDNGWAACTVRFVELVAEYIDAAGQTVLEVADDSGEDIMSASPFHNGFSVVQMYDNDKYGVIDTSGNFVIPPVYEELHACTNEMFSAKQNGKWGYIDLTGQVVIPFMYDDVYGWADGVGAVVLNGKCGLVDAGNNVILPLEYDDISDFSGGVCYAVKDKQLSIITR